MSQLGRFIVFHICEVVQNIYCHVHFGCVVHLNVLLYVITAIECDYIKSNF